MLAGMDTGRGEVPGRGAQGPWGGGYGAALEEEQAITR